jgi:hypothetical protein
LTTSNRELRTKSATMKESGTMQDITYYGFFGPRTLHYQ